MTPCDVSLSDIMFKSHLKLLVLHELSTKKCSGYDLMEIIEEKTGKRPSTGYLYPLLHKLESEEFLISNKDGRKNVYTITRKGKTFLLTLDKRRDAFFSSLSEIVDASEKKRFERFSKGPKEDGTLMKTFPLMERIRNSIYECKRKNGDSTDELIQSILENTISSIQVLSKK